MRLFYQSGSLKSGQREYCTRNICVKLENENISLYYVNYPCTSVYLYELSTEQARRTEYFIIGETSTQKKKFLVA